MFAQKGFARVLVAAVMLLTTPVMALEKKDEILMAGQFNLLSADIAMIGYDPENADYLAQADETFEEVSVLLPGWAEGLGAEQQSVARREWGKLAETLKGSDGYPGLLEGYDLNLDANQRIHYDALQAVIFAGENLQDAVLSDIEKIYLRVSSVVAGYVALTANPFGSMAMSANDGDSKVVALTSEIDALFAKALKSSGSPMEKQALRRQQAKWQFIRGTVMQGSQSAMPYIVRFQGKQIANEMAELIGG